MTWTELVAFWVTFGFTFLGFISWFSLDERRHKQQNTAKLNRHRKEMSDGRLENRIDKLFRSYAKTSDAKIKADIAELELRLGKLRGGEP